MAEGGSEPWHIDSGDTGERFCEPCHNAGTWVAIQGYCPTCEEFMCGKCLSVHENQKITRAHKIIKDKSQMPKGEHVDIGKTSLCIEVCKTHPPEIVKLHCKPHDVSGCVDCMTLHHGTCEKKRVADIAGGFRESEEFKWIQEMAENLYKDVTEFGEVLGNDLENFDETYNEIDHHITTFRQQVNAHLDTVQKRITDKVEWLRKTEADELRNLIAKNESINFELGGILQRMKNDENESSVFILTNQLKRRFAPFEETIRILKRSIHYLPHRQTIAFKPSLEILEHLQLGDLTVELLSNLTVTRMENIRANETSDRKNCQIIDCALISPGRLVVADRCNGKLKLIDTFNITIISSRHIVRIWGVTAVSERKVVITRSDSNEIEILIINERINQSICQIKVRARCQSIAYKDNMFAVSYIYQGVIDIVNQDGLVLHAIHPEQDDTDLLQKPFYITFGHIKDTIIISKSSCNSVLLVSFDGSVLQSYRSDTLVDPRGIVITPGPVFTKLFCSRSRSISYDYD